MPKPPKLPLKVKLIGIAVILYMANWVSVYAFNYPFLYCWCNPVVAPIYYAWANLGMALLCIALIAFVIFQMWIPLLGGMGMLVLIAGLPDYADAAFLMGGQCG